MPSFPFKVGGLPTLRRLLGRGRVVAVWAAGAHLLLQLPAAQAERLIELDAPCVALQCHPHARLQSISSQCCQCEALGFGCPQLQARQPNVAEWAR